jgi:glucosyltransferase
MDNSGLTERRSGSAERIWEFQWRLDMLISIVVPCHNEEAMIELFYRELCAVLRTITGYRFEVIFVNDGSRDLTLDKIHSAAMNDSRIKFLSFSRNFGKEAAVYAGLKYSQGDMIAVMDADLQDPPSLLPQMIKYIELGYDCVATRRVTRTGEPIMRSFCARQFYKLIKRLSNVDMVDGARDYRLMTRQVVNSILSLPEYHRFSKGIFGWVGFKNYWIPYENVERAAGESSWSFWNLFAYAVEGIIAFTVLPLRLASFSGIFFSVVAFVYLVYIIVRTFVLGIDVPGYTSTIAVVLFMGGIQLLSVGVLGEYLARTYMEVKHRPAFIVKDTNMEGFANARLNEESGGMAVVNLSC